MKLPELTDDEIRQWVAEPNIARVGTINGDGSPRVSSLWFRLEDVGTITLNTYEDNVHVRNVRREPRITLLIDSSDQPYRGVRYDGVAEVDGAAVRTLPGRSARSTSASSVEKRFASRQAMSKTRREAAGSVLDGWTGPSGTTAWRRTRGPGT